MSDDGLLCRADELQPGDRLRRGARLYEVTKVAVTAGEPVTVTATKLINGRYDVSSDLQFAADEQVRLVAPGAKDESPDVPQQRGLGI